MDDILASYEHIHADYQIKRSSDDIDFPDYITEQIEMLAGYAKIAFQKIEDNRKELMEECKKLNKHTEYMELLQANIVETLAAQRLFMLLRDHYEMTIEPPVLSKADIYDDIFDQETQCIIAAADKVSPGIPLEEILNEFTPHNTCKNTFETICVACVD